MASTGVCLSTSLCLQVTPVQSPAHCPPLCPRACAYVDPLVSQVAIKLIRSNEVMFKAAQTEIQVLELLAKADPDNHKHCIRMVRHFEYRNHMCLVFEPMVSNVCQCSCGCRWSLPWPVVD